MQKPISIFILFFTSICLLVYSCGTSGDPAVPNHLANTSTGDNTITFGATQYNLSFKSCTIDTSNGGHYVMMGKDIGSGFQIGILFYDASAPTASSTYTIVTTPTLSNGQCYVSFIAPLIASTQYNGTSGSVNFSPNSGNNKVTLTNVPVVNIGDSTKTSTITGSWSCQ